jgi:ketosteroid isomerase-like protein
MEADTHRDDVQAIEAIIARQLASLSWTSGISADWDKFAADFFPEAALYPAARPAKRQTVEAFMERMKSLEGTKLRSFEEAVLGTEIRVFGNVAIALAVCEITENDAEVHRGVELLLLIKDAGIWQIVSQAWDTESPSQPIPKRLLGAATGE